MGLQFKRSSETGEVPVFITIIEDFPGGGILEIANLTEGDKVGAGSPVHFDEATRLVHVVKQAEVYEAAGAAATIIKVKKSHHFKALEFIALAVGDNAADIVSIDTTNADYDSITLGETLGSALAVGDTLIQSSAEGATAGALVKTPNGLLRNSVIVGVNEDAAVVRRGTVYNRRTPARAHANIKSALPHIIFSEQF